VHRAEPDPVQRQSRISAQIVEQRGDIRVARRACVRGRDAGRLDDADGLRQRHALAGAVLAAGHDLAPAPPPEGERDAAVVYPLPQPWFELHAATVLRPSGATVRACAHNEDMTASARVASNAVVDDGARRLPGPELRPFVSGYSGFLQAGVEPMRHRGLPSPYLTVIFTLNEPLFLAAHPDPLQPADSYQTLVSGMHTTPALIVHEGWQSGIQLDLNPLGARAILGAPAGELVGMTIHGDALFGRLAAAIQDRLRCAASWAERFAVMDEALLARLRAAGDRSVVSPEVRHAWTSLLRTGGSCTVASLAAQTGWSERYLRKRFLAEVGLAPKAAGRVIRFHRAKRELARRGAAGRRLDLADLAASYGYFDQAHLDREFRLIAGCSPTAWLTEEFRNIQAGSHHHEEAW
jgi:AraC-like DNA-binding protein